MNSVQRIDRYFYFIDIEPDKQLKLQGEWMNYDLIQHIYSTNPGKLASLSVSDTTRLATIILTEKTFDETGKRKFKIKKYRPSFNLYEVRNSELDFQDDKWIRVSLFNSDVRFYRIKKLWYKIVNDTKRYSKSSD